MTFVGLAEFLFLGVAALSTLIVVVGVMSKKVAAARHGADFGQQEALGQLPGEVDSLRDELSRLNQRVEELAERQDFAERLLTQARERGQLQAPKDK